MTKRQFELWDEVKIISNGYTGNIINLYSEKAEVQFSDGKKMNKKWFPYSDLKSSKHSKEE